MKARVNRAPLPIARFPVCSSSACPDSTLHNSAALLFIFTKPARFQPQHFIFCIDTIRTFVNSGPDCILQFEITDTLTEIQEKKVVCFFAQVFSLGYLDVVH